jgi:hypothetical protein
MRDCSVFLDFADWAADNESWQQSVHRGDASDALRRHNHVAFSISFHANTRGTTR